MSSRPESQKVGILIPAYNEAPTIGEIVRKSRNYGTVIVVDDGSKDGTTSISKDNGAIVFSHKKNFGVGIARKTLFAIVSKNKLHLQRFCKEKDLPKLLRIPEFKAVVNIDADGELRPKDIPKVVKPVIENKEDLVVGARDLSKYPPYKRFGNKFLTYFTKRLFNLQISDSQSGFKAMTPTLAKKLELSAPDYAVEIDILIEAKNLEVKIGEVEVEVGTYRGESFLENLWSKRETQKGASVWDGIRNFLFLLKKRIYC